MNLPTTYAVTWRAGVCWVLSEPAHIHPMWSHPDPLAAVVVMIARAVDLDGHDITPRIAGAIQDALAQMTQNGDEQP